MFHPFTGDWKVIEHLAVPGYTRLVRQRCVICNDTRVRELPPLDSKTGATS
jgi:hypothetical protein